METILLNINTNDDDFERVIHHEVFHIIENNYKKFFPDTVWAKFNKPNFYYSGSLANPEAFSLEKLSEPNPKFISTMRSHCKPPTWNTNSRS